MLKGKARYEMAGTLKLLLHLHKDQKQSGFSLFKYLFCCNVLVIIIIEKEEKERHHLLCDHLERWGREGGRETQEGGDMGIYVFTLLYSRN